MMKKSGGKFGMGKQTGPKAKACKTCGSSMKGSRCMTCSMGGKKEKGERY